MFKEYTDEEILEIINAFLSNCMTFHVSSDIFPNNIVKNCQICKKHIKNPTNIGLYGITKSRNLGRQRRQSGMEKIAIYLFHHVCLPCFEAYRIIPNIDLQNDLIYEFRMALK